MKEYINAWGSKAYTLYNAQIYIASFVQEAVTRNRHDWLLDLMEVYMTAQPKLTRVNKYLYYFPNTPSASPRQGERSLGRTMSLWLDPPTSGFTVGQESFLVSTQFLYPVTLLIAAAARDPKLASDTRAKNFVNAFLSVALHDHYRRWIFNRDAPMGVFQVQGWGCNSGHFSHAQRVAHLYSRRFGTSYFSPYRNLGYCNSLWDVDLWIIAGVTHLLYARELRPDWFSSLSASEANALRTHVANGVELFASRLSVGTRKNRQGQNREVVYYEIGGMRGHPDYAYSGDTNPSFPGWTRQGSPAQRPPKEDPNASNDLSHSRRVVRFLFSLDKFGIPLGIVNPAWLIRVHQGMANQLAYGVFNGSFSNPLFTNFLNGTNGWYRVNYSNRENFGYEPWSWSQGRSTLTGAITHGLVTTLIWFRLPSRQQKRKPTPRCLTACKFILPYPAISGS